MATWLFSDTLCVFSHIFLHLLTKTQLPDLGPLGGHGLANPRDFLFPVAHIDDQLHSAWQIACKMNGQMFAISQDHSPFDVLAWHGNVVPFKVSSNTFKFLAEAHELFSMT